MAAESGKYLLLFDVNGVFCCKDATASSEDLERVKPEHKFQLKSGKWVLLRPGIKEFLLKLRQKYNLAIYSSTTKINILAILKAMDLHSLFSFVADRMCTQLDPEYPTRPGISEYDTVKNLSMIWSHPQYNKSRKWDRTNTLLIDDSSLKCRFNDPDNVLIIEKYSFKSYPESPHTLKDIRRQIKNCILNLQIKSLHV